MVAAPSRRSIEPVPALVIPLWDAVGALPRVPLPPIVRGHRQPTRRETCALQWLAVFGSNRDRPLGVAAYRDCYDYHSSSDVREVIYVAGTSRSIIELMRHISDSARLLNRRMIGSFDRSNRSLRKALNKLGGTWTRIGFEDMTP